MNGTLCKRSIRDDHGSREDRKRTGSVIARCDQIVASCVVAFVFLAGGTASVHGADEELLFQDIPTVYAAGRHDQPISQAPAAANDGSAGSDLQFSQTGSCFNV
jgi:hypothetical protein